MEHQDAVNVVVFSPARTASWSVLRHESSPAYVKAEVSRLLKWNAKLSLPWSVYYRVVAFAVETEPREALYASGSGPSVQLWRGEERIARLRGHVSIVRALAFAPEAGDILASASYDNTIKLWRHDGRSTNWRCVATLRGHVREVLAVSISPRRRCGRLLASGSWDGSVKVWSIERAEAREAALVQSLGGAGGAVRSVAFSPDGGALATGCDDANVRVHLLPAAEDDVDVLKPDDDDDTDVLRGHSHWVYCVAFSAASSDVLASCSQDCTVRLWLKVREDEFLGAIWTAGPSLACHHGWVYSVAFSSNGKFLASAAADTHINVFELDQGRERDAHRRPLAHVRHLATFDEHDGIVYSVAFPPRRRPDDDDRGCLLASGSVDGTLALWRLPPPRRLAS